MSGIQRGKKNSLEVAISLCVGNNCIFARVKVRNNHVKSLLPQWRKLVKNNASGKWNLRPSVVLFLKKIVRIIEAREVISLAPEAIYFVSKLLIGRKLQFDFSPSSHLPIEDSLPFHPYMYSIWGNYICTLFFVLINTLDSLTYFPSFSAPVRM